MVSILIITYNQEKFIAQAIEGALAQKTNFPFHIYIGDDASADNTSSIVADYKKKFPDKITHIKNEKNLGVQKNFIQLYSYAKTKYVAFCEGDDYWIDSYKLQIQIDFLEKNPDYSISAHRARIHSNQQLTNEYLPILNENAIYTQSDFLKGNRIVTATVVFRNILPSFPIWMEKAFPVDYCLWLMLTNNSQKVMYYNSAMAVYRIHEGGVWSTHDPTKFLQKIAFTMLNCARYLHIGDRQFIQKNLKKLYRSVIAAGYKDISRKTYLGLVIWAITHYRFSLKDILKMLTPKVRERLKFRKKLAVIL